MSRPARGATLRSEPRLEQARPRATGQRLYSVL